MIYLIAYALFCVAFAWLNSFLIKKGKRIYHALNGLLHITAAVAGWYFWGWQIGLAILFVARLFFDVALNIFRGLPIDYISANPKSIIDKLEKKIFNNDGIMPKLIYLAIIILIQFL